MVINGFFGMVMSALATATTISPNVDSSADRKGAAAYPEELHGSWVPESAICPPVGQPFDGDNVMHISATSLQGYEDQSRPSAVVLISREPLAWRIESEIDIGPSEVYVRGDPKIFVLSDGNVTVASEFHADIYRNCDR